RREDPHSSARGRVGAAPPRGFLLLVPRRQLARRAREPARLAELRGAGLALPSSRRRRHVAADAHEHLARHDRSRGRAAIRALASDRGHARRARAGRAGRRHQARRQLAGGAAGAPQPSFGLSESARGLLPLGDASGCRVREQDQGARDARVRSLAQAGAGAVNALFVPLILLALAPSPAVDQNVLRGVHTVEVLTESMDPTAMQVGFSPEEYRRDTVRRLRAAGLHVQTEAEAESNPTPVPCLYLRVGAFVQPEVRLAL